MTPLVRLANLVVAAALALGVAAAAASAGDGVRAGDERLEDLFRQLADPDVADWKRIEEEIVRRWSRSGSASMDLLLRRGRSALRSGDHEAAVEHLTALTENAPEFAEGWNARAAAYFAMGEYGLSIEDIARTLTLNPRHFAAMTGLGRIFEQLGEEESALRAYRAALAVHPRIDTLMESVERLEQRVSGREI